jgi:uncharacterized linocin/CFP29 family protein
MPDEKLGYITLTTHNHQAQYINEEKIKQLASRSFVFNALVEGDFPELAYPTDFALRLKVGAQVMFVKNDSMVKLVRLFQSEKNRSKLYAPEN